MKLIRSLFILSSLGISLGLSATGSILSFTTGLPQTKQYNKIDNITIIQDYTCCLSYFWDVEKGNNPNGESNQFYLFYQNYLKELLPIGLSIHEFNNAVNKFNEWNSSKQNDFYTSLNQLNVNNPGSLNDEKFDKTKNNFDNAFNTFKDLDFKIYADLNLVWSGGITIFNILQIFVSLLAYIRLRKEIENSDAQNLIENDDDYNLLSMSYRGGIRLKPKKWIKYSRIYFPIYSLISLIISSLSFSNFFVYPLLMSGSLAISGLTISIIVSSLISTFFSLPMYLTPKKK